MKMQSLRVLGGTGHWRDKVGMRGSDVKRWLRVERWTGGVREGRESKLEVSSVKGRDWRGTGGWLGEEGRRHRQREEGMGRMNAVRGREREGVGWLQGHDGIRMAVGTGRGMVCWLLTGGGEVLERQDLERGVNRRDRDGERRLHCLNQGGKDGGVGALVGRYWEGCWREKRVWGCMVWEGGADGGGAEEESGLGEVVSGWDLILGDW